MRKLPLVDLQAQYASIKSEIDAAIASVVASTAFVGGPAVRSFETAFAAYCEAARVVSCGNGTDAIALVLRGLGITRDDEVVTVPYTFIATSEAISMVGARTVFVDVRPDTALLDPERLHDAITTRTKAIVAVHLYGQPCDMDAINAIARERNLVVIEDAAQAHGARYRGKRVGSLATAATFSFYPGKNLGAYGDGGAMAFMDVGLAKRCAMLRDHGRTDKYLHELEGVNSRLDTLQAAVLEVKLTHLDAWNQARARAATWYLERLRGIPDLLLPTIADGVDPVWHLFVVHHPKRDAVRAALEAEGIGVGVHYPIPLHLQPAYQQLDLARGSFPVTEQLADTCLSLPMYPELTESDVDRVASALRRACS
jgi:dTDP-4-amino-4,6-dideoxygalactose transaminase